VSAGAALALVFGLAAAAFVLWPLLRGAGTNEAEAGAGGALDAARELQSQRDMLLGALKDLEDDRATDKIDEADYEEQHAKLSAQAMAVLQKLDELEHEREEAERRPLARTLQHPATRRTSPPR
jgi:hypothetical protein